MGVLLFIVATATHNPFVALKNHKCLHTAAVEYGIVVIGKERLTSSKYFLKSTALIAEVNVIVMKLGER